MNNIPRIYLDSNASTMLDPRVIAAMQDAFSAYGNPSSMHFFGQQARALVVSARGQIASYLGVNSQELIFTSSGTESIHSVIRGVFGLRPTGHLITSSIEHSCVYGTARLLESNGCAVTYLSPGLRGCITADDVRTALRKDTKLIVLAAVNNETGVKCDVASIASVAEEAGIPLLIDAVAWFGKEPIEIPYGVSALAFSGHKIHAPKGIGFVWVRRGFKIEPLFVGGEQEYGRRAGTENVLGIVGLGKAVELLSQELPIASQRMATLRDKLEQGLLSNLKGVIVNGQGPRICNTTNLSFEGVEGEDLLMKLDREGLAVSHGSACSSGALEPSRVLLQMGIARPLARSAVRFSLSRFTTENEVDRAIEIVTRTINRS